jgi:hypothetical protein
VISQVTAIGQTDARDLSVVSPPIFSQNRSRRNQACGPSACKIALSQRSRLSPVPCYLRLVFQAKNDLVAIMRKSLPLLHCQMQIHRP